MIQLIVRASRRALLVIYKHLPVFLRWKISYGLSSKFLVGMIFFVEKDGALLLVKHSYQKAWSLPGGWLKRGETIEEGARREMREEFGVSITGVRVLQTVAVKSKPVIDVAVECQFSESPKADQLEIEAFEFFRASSLLPEIIPLHKAYVESCLSRQTTTKVKV